jgi:hypothetical protein
MKEKIKMPCLECGAEVEVEKEGLEALGILNVFCSDPEKNCEDKFAFKR